MSTCLGSSFALVELFTLIGYFSAIFVIVLCSYRNQQTDSDFIIGNRSLNYWLTALSAHASDMSSWLILAYPAAIFSQGIFYGWAGIGLTLFMFLNWQFVAPKIRTITEQLGSLTLNAYFEARFADTSGKIRVVSSVMSVLYFVIYISSGLVALGLIVEELFQINYFIGVSLGLLIVMIYVFVGGYRTVAWIDLFQGFFLLGIILFIPTYIILHAKGFGPLIHAASLKGISTSLFPNTSAQTFWGIFMTITTWGLGYFGQPHIITKFMGIRQVSDMNKAKWVGISWQTIALFAATLIGLCGIYLLGEDLASSQRITLYIVKMMFPSFFAGLVLCAILAATTNVMSAQILVVASNLSEDFYKRLLRPEASSQELLWVSRFGVVAGSLTGYVIAMFQPATLNTLVLYAWSGLGGSFGPLLVLSLYLKNINRHGAFAGILVGGVVSAIWPYFGDVWQISSVLAAFCIGSLTIIGVSKIYADVKDTPGTLSK